MHYLCQLQQELKLTGSVNELELVHSVMQCCSLSSCFTCVQKYGDHDSALMTNHQVIFGYTAICL